jgi:hypothetical protein
VLQWTGDINATWYRVMLADGDGMAYDEWHPANEVCVTEACSLTLNALENGTYDWTMGAWGPGGEGPVNATPLTFELATPAAGQIVRVAPADGATLSSGGVVLEWQAASNVMWTNIIIEDGEAAVVSDEWVNCADMTCSTTITLEPGTYTWKSRTWNPAGLNETDTPSTFTVNGA